MNESIWSFIISAKCLSSFVEKKNDVFFGQASWLVFICLANISLLFLHIYRTPFHTVSLSQTRAEHSIIVHIIISIVIHLSTLVR